MTTELSYQNFLKNVRCGDHISIQWSLDKVKNAINKVDWKQSSLYLPRYLAKFFSNLHLTPQDLLSKYEKNKMSIWDESFQLDE